MELDTLKNELQVNKQQLTLYRGMLNEKEREIEDIKNKINIYEGAVLQLERLIEHEENQEKKQSNQNQ